MKRIVMSLLLLALLLVAPQTFAQWLTSGTSVYYNGGRVGIGTSTPLVELHVKDPVNQGVAFFQNPYGLVGLGVDASGGYLQADAIDFSFYAGANRVLFGESSNGYVGIGTTSPSAPLHVTSSTAENSLFVVNSVAGGSAIYATNTLDFPASYGVIGISSTGGVGVLGQSGSYRGVWGFTSSGVAVYGQSTGTGMAGVFSGNVQVTGTLSKGAGSFKIDHPLDPENKYLSHSFVESPDMMNIYNGIIVLDAEGTAVVMLPEWFEALNREFRYQLTCVGGYAPVYVASEIAGNQFLIGGGKAGLKVSWEVTGIRHDRFAERHRIPVEEAKSAEERGYYLHPEDFDQSPQRAIPSIRDEGVSLPSRKMQ